MVIDLEIVSALRRFVKGFEISDDTLAVEVIKGVGPGGIFTATHHTAHHFRGELWEPRVFAREMFDAWERGGARTEVDKAREICLESLRGEPIQPRISGALEGKFLEMIHKWAGMPVRPVEPV